MSLHWYACISTNTCCFEMHHISLETDWCALPNASSIVWIRSAVHEILADKAFTAIDGLISQSFVVTFVHPTYVRIALIWGFPVQLSLWKQSTGCEDTSWMKFVTDRRATSNNLRDLIKRQYISVKFSSYWWRYLWVLQWDSVILWDRRAYTEVCRIQYWGALLE